MLSMSFYAAAAAAATTTTDTTIITSTAGGTATATLGAFKQIPSFSTRKHRIYCIVRQLLPCTIFHHLLSFLEIQNI
uniref:Putative secreted protein n=1 Tax=Anopheles darlingi TaxID=43151 RepID=A0A2M4DRC1_ANODA